VQAKREAQQESERGRPGGNLIRRNKMTSLNLAEAMIGLLLILFLTGTLVRTAGGQGETARRMT
jgi:hypothetical protein